MIRRDLGHEKERERERGREREGEREEVCVKPGMFLSSLVHFDKCLSRILKVMSRSPDVSFTTFLHTTIIVFDST